MNVTNEGDKPMVESDKNISLFIYYNGIWCIFILKFRKKVNGIV